MNDRDEQSRPLDERSAPANSGEAGTPSSLMGAANEFSRSGPRSSNGLELSLELHIEELVLHGFGPADRYAIGEAIESELTRLFGEQGAPIAITQNREIAHLDGSAIEIHADSNLDVTGAQLAKAIYGGLTR